MERTSDHAFVRQALIKLLSVLLLVCTVMTCSAQSSSSSSSSRSMRKLQMRVRVEIDGESAIGKVDPNFVCATLDWWPPEKCDYGTCSWGNASLLNLDLSNRLLRNAVRGLSPLMLRLGGSLQDKVFYQVGNTHRPCPPFVKQSALFGFSDGCLNMSRWDALHEFFQETGTLIAFGLNALYGREKNTSQPWDSTNTRDFIRYTVEKGYQIQAWELGNELSGSGVGTSISVSQYANDMKTLRAIVEAAYEGWAHKPLVVAPDGFFDAEWFQQLLEGTGPKVIDAFTRHIYNLGAGVSTGLIDEILDPMYLNKEAENYQAMKKIVQNSGPWVQAWVGESGGAYNSGHRSVTDAFVFGFWYLDQLGMAAKYNTKVYCRQSLIGGNYGLLDRTTFQPNPDYFGALLWKKLMGTDVLSAAVNGTSYLRAYAHCSKGDAASVTVLLINLSNSTQYVAELLFSEAKPDADSGSTSQNSTKPVTGSSTSMQRLEYHLTAPNGNLSSRSILLNGNPLQFSDEGAIPEIHAIPLDASQDLIVAPTSIVFVKMTGITIPACLHTSVGF